MSKYKYLLYSQEGSIGIVTVNRPESLNALSKGVFDEIYELFQEIEASPDIRVVIVTGAGEKAFVAGADIAELHTQSSVSIGVFLGSSRRACDLIDNLSKPVIAAINGFCLGGGCELAMSCDLRLASENARFGQPEINLAIIPGAGGTQRLTRLVGMTKAKELVYTGDMIDAKTACEIGLVNKVVPRENLMAEAKALAGKLISKSSIALLRAKQAINSGVSVDLSSALDIEAQCFALCFATEDQKEGTGAFMQKRKPEFKGK